MIIYILVRPLVRPMMVTNVQHKVYWTFIKNILIIWMLLCLIYEMIMGRLLKLFSKIYLHLLTHFLSLNPSLSKYFCFLLRYLLLSKIFLFFVRLSIVNTFAILLRLTYYFYHTNVVLLFLYISNEESGSTIWYPWLDL